MNSEANVAQIGGAHYKGTPYQHWDFTTLALNNRYFEGNITKYVSRWRKKNGLEDLMKARHYLLKLTEEYVIGNIQPIHGVSHRVTWDRTPDHFCSVNGIGGWEREVVMGISTWLTRSDLAVVARILDEVIVKLQLGQDVD